MEPAVGRDDDDGRDKASSAPLAADGVLPMDMLFEILLRLPADAVCRLRLVCRSWRSLTSDPAFVKAHAGRRPLVAALDRRTRLRAVHILDVMSGSILRRILIPIPRGGFGPFHVTYPDLTTSPPDLVCVSPDHGPSFVLSSVTGAVTALPKDDPAAYVEYPSILGLVPATGEHKALHFHVESVNRSMVQSCFVLTLGAAGDQRWRAGPRPPEIVKWKCSSHRVVAGGVAYFLLMPSSPIVTVYPDPDSVASFDLATEEWRPMLAGPLSSLGTGGPSERYEFCLTKLDGYLVMVQHYRKCPMNLWFLVDADKGFWTKKYSIQCKPHCWTHTFGAPYPLAILDDRRIVFRVKDGFVMYVYDPSTSTWTGLVGFRGYCAIGIHEGSLLCSCVQAI